MPDFFYGVACMALGALVMAFIDRHVVFVDAPPPIGAVVYKAPKAASAASECTVNDHPGVWAVDPEGVRYCNPK